MLADFQDCNGSAIRCGGPGGIEVSQAVQFPMEAENFNTRFCDRESTLTDVFELAER